MTKLASLEDGHNVAPKSASNGSSPIGNFLFQVKLLLWKRYLESTKSKWDLLKVLLPAVLFFILMILLYAVFDFFAAGAIEPFLVPLAFWIYIQRIVVQIMFEKSSRLQESMRMMGLSDVAYYTSYFISDGVILGFLLSFLVTLFTVGGLFNGANFGVILGFLFVFCLSAIPFAFFVCAFFDTPQTSGQATLGILFGKSILFIHFHFTGITYHICYVHLQVSSSSTSWCSRWTLPRFPSRQPRHFVASFRPSLCRSVLALSSSLTTASPSLKSLVFW